MSAQHKIIGFCCFASTKYGEIRGIIKDYRGD